MELRDYLGDLWYTPDKKVLGPNLRKWTGKHRTDPRYGEEAKLVGKRTNLRDFKGTLQMCILRKTEEF